MIRTMDKSIKSAAPLVVQKYVSAISFLFFPAMRNWENNVISSQNIINHSRLLEITAKNIERRNRG